MIDYRLETFLTLCRQMNYRRTAEEMNITQPAVTQHIQYLEKKFSCKLFKYEKKVLSMTKEAHLLKRFAENIIYQEKEMMGQLKASSIFLLKIGATKTIGEFVIGRQIKDFLEVEGNEIQVEVDNTEKLLSKLEDSELDFALIEGHFDRKNFSSQLYRRESFVGICGKEHPFAGKSISFEDLFQKEVFLREVGSGTRRILELNLLNRNHSIKEFSKITTIGNFGLLFDLILNGNGVSFAYEAILEKNPKLAAFYIKDMEMLGEFNYVYLDNPESQAKVDVFKKYG